MKLIPDANDPFFSFRYGGRNFNELEISGRKIIRDDCPEEFSIEYLLPGGLAITQQVRVFAGCNAVHWVLYFENRSSLPSEILSSINDCDITAPLAIGAPVYRPGYVAPPSTPTVHSSNGSDCRRDDFFPSSEFLMDGSSLQYAPVGGRSSDCKLPFFDVNCGSSGVIAAIGWTGQWNACFSRKGPEIRIRTGIEDAEFNLLPGEKFRTSSVLLIEYEFGQDDGHNALRRLIRDHFSIIGQPGRPEAGPLCSLTWGALSSVKMIRRIESIASHGLGFEYYWIDAGWYGQSTGDCPDEFTGDWAIHTGDWRVNPTYHPDGLAEVSRAVADAGMKLLLWVEPERVLSTTPLPKEHPEWFFKLGKDTTRLLNLGNPDALAYTIDLISGFIRDLKISCYRQDFNMRPLDFWRGNDAPDRRGVNEIRHIMGLYAFWDALLERFPGLIIDNCSSGGRRIDIESLSRSIPLWRSDYQCTWDKEPEAAQIHTTGLSWWVPYSGTGAGCEMGDTYRIRSCYSAAMAVPYWAYDGWEFSEEQPHAWVHRQNVEFKQIRKYFACDYYLLAPPSLDDGGWAAWQYDDPVVRSGIVLAFRRPQSPLEQARLHLGGMNSGSRYRFEDADTGEVFEADATTLAEEGLAVCLPEKRSSKLLYYQVI